MSDSLFPSQVDETQRRAFETACKQDPTRPLDEYLPDPATPQFAATLEELVHIQMEFAWKAWRRDRNGPKPPLTEDYLNRYEVLREEAALKRLALQEFHVRLRFGDLPRPRDFAARFPGLIEESELAEPPASREASPPRYDPIAEHARGGFGAVWRARDLKLGREVALKRLNRTPGRNSDLHRRFVEEAKIAAQLEHPGIVPVYDLEGVDCDEPFYTMKLLQGDTLAEAVAELHRNQNGDQSKAVERRRLVDAFLTVVQTIEFAHANGVIHRDIKPQNIILGAYGETIILDWGLARQLSSSESPADWTADESAGSRVDPSLADSHPYQATKTTRATHDGAVIGTPCYMSPEQAAGTVELLDQLSDVYSLGATLFHIISGRPPSVEQKDGQIHLVDSFPELRSGGRLSPLTAICAKAVSRDRANRYQSVSELRVDLERHLADQPVSVYRERLMERAGRWAKRHRSLVTGGVASLCVALISVSLLAIVVRDSNIELGRALGVAEEARSQANLEKTRTEAALGESERNLYVNRVLLARSELFSGNVGRAEKLLDACPKEYRKWEWEYLRGLCGRGLIAECQPHQAVVRRVVFDRTGERFATAAADGTARVWNSSTRKVLLSVKHGLLTSAVAFSADSKRLFTSGIEKPGQGEVKEWNLETAELVRTRRGHSRYIYGLAASPDGLWLASGGEDQTIRIYASDNEAAARTLSGHTSVVQRLAFSPDSKRLASASRDKTIRIWEVESGSLLATLEGHTLQVNGIQFHPSGRWLASASSDRSVRVWDTTGQKKPFALLGHTGYVWDVAFHPGGHAVISCGFDRTIRVWKLNSGNELMVYRGHNSHVRSVAIDRAAKHLVSGDGGGSVKVWQPVDDRSGVIGVHVAYHPDGDRLVTADGNRAVLWAAPEMRQLREFHGHEDTVHSVCISPSGKLLATSGKDKVVRVWELESGKSRLVLSGHEDEVTGVLFAADETRLVSSSADGTLRVWSMDDGSTLQVLEGHTGKIFSISASPDGYRVASASEDETARVWDLASGAPVLNLKGHCGVVLRVRYSPNGSKIVTTSYDGTVKVWDAEQGSALQTLELGNTYVNDAMFNADESRLAVGSEDSLLMWETERYQQVFVLGQHQCIQEFCFSPDGKTLAVAGRHNGVRLLAAE